MNFVKENKDVVIQLSENEQLENKKKDCCKKYKKKGVFCKKCPKK